MNSLWMKNAALFAVACLVSAGTALAQSHDHVGHITTGFGDTPGKVGLLTILEQEAMVAAQHADYGKSNPATHMPHVRHALDASSEKGGPGKGYGVVKAAEGVAAHMDYAAKAGDASDSLKAHSVHIIASAKNVAAWAKEALAASADTSAAGMAKVAEMTQWILKGRDANGDGKISWEAGEGGIAQIKQHLDFIKH